MIFVGKVEDMVTFQIAPSDPYRIGGAQPAFRLRSTLNPRFRYKRGFDIVGSLLLLVIAVPVLLTIAIAIRIERRGPVLFHQEREGRWGRRFVIHKFRTLDDGGAATRLGLMLRRTGFDELPQLFNVLVGEMSLVGPRPYIPDMTIGVDRYADLAAEYDERLSIWPGLTGLAQSEGYRGPILTTGAARQRLARDLDYLGIATPWLDLAILARTLTGPVLGGFRG
jgi:lipopolysaccharide/colanic/teichoic acid biosynthesis glycosyltransferase